MTVQSIYNIMDSLSNGLTSNKRAKDHAIRTPCGRCGETLL